MDDHDLNAYERLRLENIKRNAEFLASIGLLPSSSSPANRQLDSGNESVIKHRQPAKSKKKRARLPSDPEELACRRSKRLSNKMDGTTTASVEDTSNEQVEEVDEKEFNYENMPFESSDLDDYEFEVYAMLRKWRLMKSRELDIEPYKVFQNRTLCELIRRRRNNSQWAMSSNPSNDLLECWGIGPSKVKEDGFGSQALIVLAQKEAEEKLDGSRKCVA
jgi:superfamily II DNA helicase RecQ